MTGPSLPLVTQSQLRTFRRCQREHHLAYDLAIRPASSEAAPLRFGSAVHEGLAALWQGLGLASALDAVRCALLVREEENLDPAGEEVVSLKPVLTEPVFV